MYYKIICNHEIHVQQWFPVWIFNSVNQRDCGFMVRDTDLK